MRDLRGLNPRGWGAVLLLPHRAVVALEGTRSGRLLLGVARSVREVARGFRGEKISLRASALTYITMLSLVPLLAVAFAIVRALGQEGLRREVNEFIYANLAPGTREQIAVYLDEFIARASAGAMGGVGAFFLLVSAVSLLHNIERSLNDIWGITRKRTLLQRGLIYWGVLTLGPIALGVSLLFTAGMQTYVGARVPRGILTTVPLGTTVALLTLIYMAAPTARVRFRPAFTGALIAGIAWEAAKWAYAVYATRSFRYNAIYGSLGAVPLFLLWIYVSWLFFLFGARLGYALQVSSWGRLGRVPEDARSRELLCARLAVASAVAYLGSTEPPTASQLGKRLGIEPAAVMDAVRRLREAGLLAEAHGGGLVPARPPEAIFLLDISRASRGAVPVGGARPLAAGDALSQALVTLFDDADRRGHEALARADLAGLARLLLQERERKANSEG